MHRPGMCKHKRAILAAFICGLWFFSASIGSAESIDGWVREITESDEFVAIEKPLLDAYQILLSRSEAARRLDAFAATLASREVDVHDPVAGDDCPADIELLDRLDHTTAATATVADIAWAALDVVGRLRQASVLGLTKNRPGLLLCHPLGVTQPDHRLGGKVQGKTAPLGSVASLATMTGRVTAHTERNPHGRGRADNLAGPLPVEDLRVVVLGKRLLADQRAAHLCGAGKDAAGKTVVFVHVPVEQLGQLARVVTDAGMLFITTIFDGDDFELERLALLTSPYKVVTINVGENDFNRFPIDAQLPYRPEMDEAMDTIIRTMKEREILRG